jgi:hypothetical protein
MNTTLQQGHVLPSDGHDGPEIDSTVEGTVWSTMRMTKDPIAGVVHDRMVRSRFVFV